MITCSVWFEPVDLRKQTANMGAGILCAGLLVICTVVKICQGQQFAYFRCNNATKTLQYVYFSETADPVYDIFSQSRQSTCSLRAGAVTGQGSAEAPYVLEIDLSRGLQDQSPDCGVTQEADNTVRLEMLVQSSCTGVSSSDLSSLSSCRMVIPSNPQQTSGSASYFCQPPSTVVFRFSGPASDMVGPADIYALGRRGRCSKSVGAGRGQGLSGDPFEIRINTTSSDCGVQNQGAGVFNVTMYVQQLPSLITTLDSSYLLTCNFTSSGSQTLETVVIPAISNPPTNTTRPLESTSSLSVVSEGGTAAVTSLVVGDQIRLVAQLIDGPASGMRLTSCDARPGPGLQPVVQVLGSDGCSTGPVLVPPFIGQSPVGRLAMTNVFRAFKFDQSDTVYFSCQASFCYDNDLSCLGSHCGLKARRKRETISPRQDTLVISIRVLDSLNGTTYTDKVRTTSSADPASNRTNTVTSAEADPSWPVSALIVVSCMSGLVVLCCLLILWITCRRAASRKAPE